MRNFDFAMTNGTNIHAPRVNLSHVEVKKILDEGHVNIESEGGVVTTIYKDKVVFFTSQPSD